MDTTEFRSAAHAAIDEIADYYDNISSLPVVSQVAPGYLRPLLPSSAPIDPEPLPSIQADIQAKILPGITHWQSPRFMAFFPCSSSSPAAVAELYSNAFNGAHFNWICSPAVTELETVVLDWLAKAMKLPECFLSGGSTHGGGVIHGSASEAITTVMCAARDKYLAQVTAHLPSESEEKEEELWRRRSKLVALGSTASHSSTKKAAQILGVRFATVPVSDEGASYGMKGEALAAKLEELAKKGLEPFYLTATLGTTDTCAVDDFEGIASVLSKRTSVGDLWVHVDAAYAGSALLLEENQHLTTHMAEFDSFNFNPHKWLMTTFDCSAVWVRSRRDLISALSIKPAYLRNQFSDDELVTDYRDWQIPLGRRFRSLKLWFVMRAFGISGLQKHLRNGVGLAERLEVLLRERGDIFEVFTPARFALVTFRVKGESEEVVNKRTEEVYESINAGGEYYLTSTVVDGKFAIRVCTGVPAVREEHVQGVFDALVKASEQSVKA